jgi:hypothetical protein
MNEKELASIVGDYVQLFKIVSDALAQADKHLPALREYAERTGNSDLKKALRYADGLMS